MKLREIIVSLINKKKREKMFHYITSTAGEYRVVERKKQYEMVFEDGCITNLPKKLFNFGNSAWQSQSQATLNIGKCSYLQNLSIAFFSHHRSVTIGSFCAFGANVEILLDGMRAKYTFSAYPLDLLDPYSKAYSKYIQKLENLFVKIGNDCFIGEGSKIMSNVTIGDGVILGTRSLVPSGSNLLPFGIYVGQPVKFVGWRYEAKIIEQMQSLQWWNWTKSKIIESGLQHIEFGYEIESIIQEIDQIIDKNR